MPALLDHKRWSELQKERRNLKLHDAARELGVAAVELLASDCGHTVTRLEGSWADFIKELPKLGRVLCVTRNDAFTHERFGEFRSIEFFDQIGVVLGEDIDLRLMMQHWRYGFASEETTPKGIWKSFLFFDAAGTEIHKITLQREGSEAAYEALKERFTSRDQSPTQPLEKLAPRPPELPDPEIDVAGFREAWLALEDTVHFTDILRSFRVRREQGLRLAPPGYTRQVGLDSVRLTLEAVASMRLPVMIFVRSSGCIQINSGPISQVKMFGQDLLNILDQEFNLHVRLPVIHSAWVVTKPTIDGNITSLEVFDANGENVALFFGKRGYGKPERPQWKYLLRELS